jgi:hypothetical protein
LELKRFVFFCGNRRTAASPVNPIVLDKPIFARLKIHDWSIIFFSPSDSAFTMTTRNRRYKKKEKIQKRKLKQLELYVGVG